MRLPTKLLLITLAGLLLIPFSACAELVLGVYPQPTSLLKSVPQAQRLAAYLEHRLEESVVVRIFLADEELRAALVSGAVVDLALLTYSGANAEKGLRVLVRPTPRAEVAAAGTLVARSGLEEDRFQRLAEVLAGMERDEGGRALLYDLGLQSLATTASGATPLPSAPLVPARSGLPVSGEGKALVLGALAADVAQAEVFARDFGQRLGLPLRVRSFPAEDELLQWLGRYRMIDLAFLPESAERQALSAQVLRLARSAELAGRQAPAASLLVARPGLPPRQLSAVRQAVAGGSVAQRPAPAPAFSRSAMRKPTVVPAPVSLPLPPAAARGTRTDGRVASSLTLGSVPGVLFLDEAQAREFARLLGSRLGVPVNSRSFPDQQTLQQWLGRHRMVDIGVFEAAFLRRQPAGSALPLLPAGAFGGGEVSLVARQGLSSATLQRLRDGLNQLVDDPDVERLLGGGAVSPPPPRAAAAPLPSTPRIETPIAVPAPPAVAIVPPTPAPAPPPAPVRPAPVVKAPPPPAPPTPLPEPPVVQAEPVQPPPPAPAPKSEPTETKKDSEPLLRLSLPGERDEVYLVPFTTVMVPDAVVETIFDRFVEAMSADGLSERYNFVILKGGLDSVDSDWRRDHDYVTGEIFGYVEESGCCSTDIRTKSRVAFHRAGSDAPALRHEYPVKTFFDHDYSTIDKERRKLAELIADELAAKVRATLGGS